jgi:hypothetical protein
MKKLLYLFSMLPSVAFAQNTELSLTGGISLNGQPSANMYYVGNKSALNYAASFTYLRNIDLNDHWQIGGDLYVHSLASKSSKTYNYLGDEIGGDNKRFEYAKAVLTPDFITNYKFHLDDDEYIYAGAALGLVYTINDHTSTNPRYTYKGPNGGIGASTGVQAGIVYGISPRLALNGELAMRYYYITYDAPAPYRNGEELHYGIVTVPITVGIRYRIGFERQYNVTTGRYMLLRN